MIRIGFSAGDTLVARIIRWVTRAPVSHCFLIIDDTYFGTTLVMEAVMTGYRLVPYEGYQKNNKIVAIFDPPFSIDVGTKQAVLWLGERYDMRGVAGMFFVTAARWLKLKIRNPWFGANALFCSEAVTRILQLSRYPGADSLVPEDMSPEDLLLFLNNRVANARKRT